MPWGPAAASGGAVLAALVLRHLGGTRGESSSNRPGVHRRASLQGGALAWARSTWRYLGAVRTGCSSATARRSHAARARGGDGTLVVASCCSGPADAGGFGTLVQRGELFTGQLVEKMWQPGFEDLVRDVMKQMRIFLADCDIFSAGSGSLPIQYSIFHMSANLPLVKVFRPP